LKTNFNEVITLCRELFKKITTEQRFNLIFGVIHNNFKITSSIGFKLYDHKWDRFENELITDLNFMDDTASKYVIQEDIYRLSRLRNAISCFANLVTPNKNQYSALRAIMSYFYRAQDEEFSLLEAVLFSEDIDESISLGFRTILNNTEQLIVLMAHRARYFDEQVPELENSVLDLATEAFIRELQIALYGDTEYNEHSKRSRKATSDINSIMSRMIREGHLK